MYQTIVLAYDGSEHAQKAAALAGEEARVHGAKVVIVYAYDPVPEWLGEPLFEEALARRVTYAQEKVKEARERLGEVPAGIEEEILEGPAAEAILNVAKVHQADLIVMGTRGLGGLAGVLLGSQSQKVLALSPCPVLLVK